MPATVARRAHATQGGVLSALGMSIFTRSLVGMSLSQHAKRSQQAQVGCNVHMRASVAKCWMQVGNHPSECLLQQLGLLNRIFDDLLRYDVRYNRGFLSVALGLSNTSPSTLTPCIRRSAQRRLLQLMVHTRRLSCQSFDKTHAPAYPCSARTAAGSVGGFLLGLKPGVHHPSPAFESDVAQGR